MTTSILERPACICYEQCASHTDSLAQRRADALDRLISLLEGSSLTLSRYCLAVGDSENHQLRRIARLRAARAVYALSSGVMNQIGTSAYMRPCR